MKLMRMVPLLTVVIIIAGCGREPQLEIRTFEVDHMEMDRAVRLIEPYIFYEREGTTGTYSVSGNVLTIRETADNLRRIEAVLEQYDMKRPAITLHVDVIEADGGDVDPAIADIQNRLSELFRFEGYRRAAGGVLSATEDAHVGHSMGTHPGAYKFSAVFGRLTRDEGQWLLYADLELMQYGTRLLSTSAVLRDGQTTLVGTTVDGDIKAVILAIRPVIEE